MEATIASARLPADALDPQGTVADSIAGLWWPLLGLGTGVFVVFALLLAFGLQRGGLLPGHGGGPADSDGERERDAGQETVDRPTVWLIGGGVAMPAIIIGVVLIATVVALADPPLEADGGDLVVEITGYQWWWEVTYPDHDVVTANEVHIPAGQPVELRLRSADVIHSFWVPALAGKMDLLPERTNTLVIDADRPGRYPARCAEFCGVQHARMELTVVAHDPADFESWVAEQRAPPRAADAEEYAPARDLFTSSGCADCHTVDGTEADGTGGPDLSHLASRERIAAGSLRLDSVTLTEWIADPHATKPGARMPASDLGDDEIEALVAYLESLR